MDLRCNPQMNHANTARSRNDGKHHPSMYDNIIQSQDIDMTGDEDEFVQNEEETNLNFQIQQQHAMSTLKISKATEKLANMTKSIQDDIHGHIRLPLLIFKIMDTEEFQRLRNLKQCGAVYFVYPGASHNRFEHSIGVSYLSGMVANHLKNEQPELGITISDVLCIQVAGLCHDMGHGPFSHMYEHVLEEYYESEDKGDMLTEDNANHFCHEEMSCKMLDSLIRRNNIRLEDYGLDSEIDLMFIKECILGDKAKYRKGRPVGKSYLYDIVSNVRSGLDMDKLDYFMRDSRNTGVLFGCNVSRLISESRVAWSGTRYEISFPEKLVHEVLSLFRTRFLLHLTVYQHKVVKAVELMIIDALKIADRAGVFSFQNENGTKTYSLTTCHQDTFAFMQAQDDVLQQISRSSIPAAQPAKELVKRIRKRDLYVSVGEVPVTRNQLVRMSVSQSDKGLQKSEPIMSLIEDEQTNLSPKTPPFISSNEDEENEDNNNNYDEEEKSKLIPETPLEQRKISKQKNEDILNASDDTYLHNANSNDAGFETRTTLDVLYDKSVAEITKALLDTHAAQHSEPRLTEDHIIVEKIKMHWGQGSRNPMNGVKFFSKNDVSTSHKVAESKYEAPRSFVKEAIRIFAKDKRLAQSVFTAFTELTQNYIGAQTPFLSQTATSTPGTSRLNASNPGSAQSHDLSNADMSGGRISTESRPRKRQRANEQTRIPQPPTFELKHGEIHHENSYNST